MATIRERTKIGGEKTYEAIIRKKGFEEWKTFSTKEDAELFAFFKEKLHRNMCNFDIPLEDRITLCDVIELKIKDMKDMRQISEFLLAKKRVQENIKPHVFLQELNIQDWVECLKNISLKKVPVRGNAVSVDFLSTSSLRRVFATLSSAFSNAISLGVNIKNHPLEVVQKHITHTIINKKT
jgi:hypothetical protein